MRERAALDWGLCGHFVIKFSYDGSPYHGLAVQTPQSCQFTSTKAGKAKQPRSGEDQRAPAVAVPTVEAVIEKALQRAQLIKSLTEAGASRCGRTDKGVHARGNYLTLRLRLKPPTAGLDTEPVNTEPNVLVDTSSAPYHYDYRKILNSILPPSIRVTYVKSAPAYLDARFHCLSRYYKYFFPLTADLDLGLMDLAARQFVGNHDFRNFCKIDPSANKTTTRLLTVCSVRTVDAAVGVVLVSGPAFLWHQVRCIVGCLLDVGRGVHPVGKVAEWLDIVRTPSKPPYTMAGPEGLVLWDCAFECLGEEIETSAEAFAPPTALPADEKDTWSVQLRELEVRRAILQSLRSATQSGGSFGAAH